MRHETLVGLLIAATSVVLAQEAPSRQTFEVATIKRNTSLASGGGGGMAPGGRFRLVNVDVRTMISIAYRMGAQLSPSQIVGGPEWTSSEYYDVAGKVGDDLADKPPAALIAAQPLLLQSLLEDRFRLNVHRETRQLPRYALVLARKDGALGPHLLRTTVDCTVDRQKCSLQGAPGHFTGGAVRITTLIGFLSANVQRVVIDRTGLDGTFELDLEFAPDHASPPLSGDTTPPSADKPSIFTALEDQLGLKLQSERGPVDVVVIDHIERPTEN
jgi:uncharacterized protein (TIGR03435 family)